MNLSKRLQTIANLVPNNSKVIDVGCDHGLLSIYLSNEKNCDCIATDINENAIKNAKVNITKYKAQNVETKVCDGINKIKINKSDYIIIAGMGTTTIKHILSSDNISNNLIISSNNQLYELRKFVVKLGYYIADEKYIEERRKKYIIIKFQKGHKKYSKEDLKYGPISKKNIDYLLYELEKLYEIKEKIINSNFIVKYKNKKEIKNLLKLINKMK